MRFSDEEAGNGKHFEGHQTSGGLIIINIHTTTHIIGFDSAWADNPKKKGAICGITVEASRRWFSLKPSAASFPEALEQINQLRPPNAKTVIAIDQPTIVPNLSGSRPAEKVAASVVSWVGGGVQPANRGKRSMFGDDAPIWSFKSKLNAIDDPMSARDSDTDRCLLEVFPALGLAGFEQFCGRYLAPKYNPAIRKKFNIEHWRGVVSLALAIANRAQITDISFLQDYMVIERPGKSDQDLLDSVLCALWGYCWRFDGNLPMAVIGDTINGYIVAPVNRNSHARLAASAKKIGVPIFTLGL